MTSQDRKKARKNEAKKQVKRKVRDIMTNKDRKIRRSKRGKLA